MVQLLFSCAEPVWFIASFGLPHVAGRKLKKMWKKQVEEESVKVGVRREDAFCR